jgi:hypothetical protein
MAGSGARLIRREKEAMRVGQVAEGLRQEEISYLNRS